MDWIINFLIAFPTPLIFVLGVFGWMWYKSNVEKSPTTRKLSKIAFTSSLIIGIILTLQSQMLRPMTKQDKLPEVVYQTEGPAGEPTDRMLKPEKTSEQRSKELKEEFNFLEKSQEIINK